MENKINDIRMSSCPKFINCNAPKCPLDEFQSNRINLPEDDRCTLSKKKRLMLGDDLPKNGLKGQEYTAIIGCYGSIEAYKKAILSKFPLLNKIKTDLPSNTMVNTVSCKNKEVLVSNK